MEVTFVKKEKDEWQLKLHGVDLGFANLVADRLLQSKSVSFAAAVLDHPLKGNPILTVRAKDPAKEFEKALTGLNDDLTATAGALKKA